MQQQSVSERNTTWVQREQKKRSKPRPPRVSLQIGNRSSRQWRRRSADGSPQGRYWYSRRICPARSWTCRRDRRCAAAAAAAWTAGGWPAWCSRSPTTGSPWRHRRTLEASGCWGQLACPLLRPVDSPSLNFRNITTSFHYGAGSYLHGAKHQPTTTNNIKSLCWNILQHKIYLNTKEKGLEL